MPGRVESGLPWPDSSVIFASTGSLDVDDLEEDNRFSIPSTASWISRWPTQRLRVGIGGLIFFVIEVLWLGALPLAVTFGILGLALASLWSAQGSIDRLSFEARLEALKDAMTKRSVPFLGRKL